MPYPNMGINLLILSFLSYQNFGIISQQKISQWIFLILKLNWRLILNQKGKNITILAQKIQILSWLDSEQGERQIVFNLVEQTIPNFSKKNKWEKFIILTEGFNTNNPDYYYANIKISLAVPSYLVVTTHTVKVILLCNYFCIHHIPPDEWTGGQFCLASVSLWVYWNIFCKYFHTIYFVSFYN